MRLSCTGSRNFRHGKSAPLLWQLRVRLSTFICSSQIAIDPRSVQLEVDLRYWLLLRGHLLRLLRDPLRRRQGKACQLRSADVQFFVALRLLLFSFIPGRNRAFHHGTFHLHARDGSVLKLARHRAVEGLLTRCLEGAPVTFHGRLEAALLHHTLPVESWHIGRGSLESYCFIWLRQITAGGGGVQP